MVRWFMSLIEPVNCSQSETVDDRISTMLHKHLHLVTAVSFSGT